MNQLINYIEHKRVTAPIELKDSYEFRSDRKFHWLQRLLLWALSKLGCYAMGEKTSCIQHRFHTDDVVEGIYRQSNGILDFYGHQGRYLLIGHDLFEKLIGSPEVQQMMRFSGSYHRGSGQIMGMDIVVIPWMEGMLVVPELPKSVN